MTEFTLVELVGEGTVGYHWLGSCGCGVWEKEGPLVAVGSGPISLSGVLVVEEYWWGD